MILVTRVTPRLLSLLEQYRYGWWLGWERTYDAAFNKEVVSYIEAGHTVHAAGKIFSMLDHYEYNNSMFYQWHDNGQHRREAHFRHVQRSTESQNRNASLRFGPSELKNDICVAFPTLIRFYHLEVH